MRIRPAKVYGKCEEKFEQLWQTGLHNFSENRFLVKSFAFLAIAYLIGISAILRADFYYIDDLGRTALGYTGWETFSRYLSVLSSYFIHAGRYLTDVSPLPQLIAVVIMAAAGVIVICVVTGKKRFPVFCLVAAIPMGLSPYFLECFSYRFDAPYMALSVFVSVFPLLFYRDNQVKYVLFSIFGTVCMCTTYQASSGIFPMLVAALCIKRWVNGEKTADIIWFAVVSAVGYLAGLLLFRLVLMHEVVNYSSTTVAPASQLVSNAVKNFDQYISYWRRDFKTNWMILIACMCIGFVYVTVRDTKQNKLLTLLLSAVVLAVLLLLSLGVYPFLVAPLFSPRGMYGLGFFMALMGIWIADAPKAYPAKLACLALSWVFFVFSFTYGNALSVQSQYTDYRISSVINELLTSETLDADSSKLVRITGSIGYAPAIENMPQDYQMLNRLVPVTFSDSTWYWGGFGFENYYGLENITITDSNERMNEDLPLIADNVLHTIRGDDEYIWIDLH